MEVWLLKKIPDGVECAGSEDASSLEYTSTNVGNLAIEVVG